MDELVIVAEDVNELDMLILIAKADILAVRADWWHDTKVDELRRAVLSRIARSLS